MNRNMSSIILETEDPLVHDMARLDCIESRPTSMAYAAEVALLGSTGPSERSRDKFIAFFTAINLARPCHKLREI